MTVTLALFIISAAVIYLACEFFVNGVEWVTSLLLSPVATELPETLNAVIWVRQGKERLALANISGAMMIQATVPTAFGVFFTPWLLDRSLILGAAITTLSILALYLGFRNVRVTGHALAAVGLLYALFAGVLMIII